MTIGGLWSYVAKHCAEARARVPISSFRGLRVAVDAMGEFFKLRMVARSEIARKFDVLVGPLPDEEVDKVWLRMVIVFIIELLEEGITPILVFEKGVPRLKVGKHKERAEERKKTQDAIDALRAQLQADDRFLINPAKMQELRDLESSLRSVPAASREKLFRIIDEIGIPCVMSADGIEAERTAAILTKYNIAAATYSPDGDSLVHGCSIIIRGKAEPICIDNVDRKSFEIVYQHKILESMKITQKMFVDVCIMAGCDYNKNIKSIGIAKALKFIKAYGSIDAVPIEVLRNAAHKDWREIVPESETKNCYDHIECRKEFDDVPLEDLMDLDHYLNDAEEKGKSVEELIALGFFDSKPFDQFSSDAIESVGTGRDRQRLENLMRNLPKPRSFNLEKEVIHNTAFGPVAVKTGEALGGVTEFVAGPPKTRGGRGRGRGRGKTTKTQDKVQMMAQSLGAPVWSPPVVNQTVAWMPPVQQSFNPFTGQPQHQQQQPQYQQQQPQRLDV